MQTLERLGARVERVRPVGFNDPQHICRQASKAAEQQVRHPAQLGTDGGMQRFRCRGRRLGFQERLKQFGSFEDALKSE